MKSNQVPLLFMLTGIAVQGRACIQVFCGIKPGLICPPGENVARDPPSFAGLGLPIAPAAGLTRLRLRVERQRLTLHEMCRAAELAGVNSTRTNIRCDPA